MKFHCNVIIDLPIDKVIELFDNPDNLKEWQDGFVSYTHLSGTPGEPGAKSKLIYNANGKEIELIETITVRNLPEELSAIFEHHMMTNTMKNSFIAIGMNKTKYDIDIEYTKFNGMLKYLSWLMKGTFKAQTQKWINQFKDFAEKHEAKEDPNNSFIVRY